MSALRPAITADVSLRLGDFQLDAAFTAPEGVTGLFGPSGSGKTTLLHVIAGLLRADRGRIAAGQRVLFDHERGEDMPAHRRRVALVHQDAQLFPHLTVRQNLAFARWFAGAREAPVTMHHITDVLEIAPLLERRPGRLSGGEKQRVALARAILAAPDVLLMDEPLASLDDALRQETLGLIGRMRDAVPLPMLYVSHRAGEIRALAAHVVKLDRGRVTEQGPPAAVLPG